MAARGISRDNYFKDAAATQIATSMVVDTTYELTNTVAFFDCRRHGSVVFQLDWEDVVNGATPTILTFKLEFCVVPVANAVAADWFQESEEDTNGDITLKERTITVASAGIADGVQLVMGDIKCGSYHGVRMSLKVDSGTSDVSIWAAGGSE